MFSSLDSVLFYSGAPFTSFGRLTPQGSVVSHAVLSLNEVFAIWLQDGDSLFLANTSNPMMPLSLVSSGVASFSISSDNKHVVFLKNDGGLWSHRLGDSAQVLLREFVSSFKLASASQVVFVAATVVNVTESVDQLFVSNVTVASATLLSSATTVDLLVPTFFVSCDSQVSFWKEKKKKGLVCLADHFNSLLCFLSALVFILPFCQT